MATTQLTPTGTPGRPYGSFAGKLETLVVVPPAVAAVVRRAVDAGYLVEVETVLRPRNWIGQSTIFFDATTVFWDSTSVTFDSSSGTYVAELSRRVTLLTAVTEDGVALTERASPALVSANAGSWHWEGATHRLWVRTSDDGPALGHRLLVTAVDGFKLGDGPSVYLRHGVPVAYEGRILSLPDVSLSLQSDSSDPVLGAVVSLGELALANHDGLVEEWQAERFIVGHAVRSYRGDLGDPRAVTGPEVTSLDLWLAALTDAVAPTPEQARFTLMPTSRTFAADALTTTFDVVTYPDMNPEIAGIKIPRVYNRVGHAEAFRIASGRWKVADHAIGDLYAAVTAADAVAPILTMDLVLGEFTADVAYDGEARLYVDVDGAISGALGPGALLRQLVLDLTAFTDADLDQPALAALDAARVTPDGVPIRIGVQLVDGTVRDALDRVARSAFADWFLTRQGLVSARARIPGGANLVPNPSLEVDLAGWRALDPSGTLTREAAGDSAPAGDWLMRITGEQKIAAAWMPYIQGRGVTVTALMSAAAPAVAMAADWQLVDAYRTVFAASDPISVPAGTWTRGHWRIAPETLAALVAVTWDSTDVFFDNVTGGITSSLTFDLAGALDLWIRALPVAAGGTPGLSLDDIAVTPTIQADDTNAEVTAITPEPLILWEVSVSYRVDPRTKQGPLARASNAAARDLYPLAESRQIAADCVDAASAQVVADAYLAWYGHARARTAIRLFDWERALEPGDVIDAWHLSRTLRPPASAELYTIVSVREAPTQSGDVPTIDVDAILHYDPAVGPLVTA